MNAGQGRGEWIGLYAASVALAVAASAVLIEATGGDTFTVFEALVEGSLTGNGRWGLTLGAAAPLLLVALGTIISARAGLVNIGQEGQLLFGAAFAVYFGFRIGGPAPLNLVIIIVFGVIGGAFWAGIAGLLRFGRGVPEVLSTLLLVTVASQLVSYGLSQPWLLQSDSSANARNNVSEQLAEGNRLPNLGLFGNQIPFATFLAAALGLLVAFALARTVWGFRLEVMGKSPNAAQRAGISQSNLGMKAMVISGGFAGLAGAAMFAGGGFQFSNYQFVPGFSGSIGWTGLLVALVSRERALPAVLVALVFGALRTGSGFVGSTGVEARVTSVVEGLLVLALLIPPAVMFLRDRGITRSVSAEAG